MKTRWPRVAHDDAIGIFRKYLLGVLKKSEADGLLKGFGFSLDERTTIIRAFDLLKFYSD